MIILIFIMFSFPLFRVRSFGGFQFTVNSLNKPQILDCQCALSIEARGLAKPVPHSRTQRGKVQKELRLKGDFYHRY